MAKEQLADIVISYRCSECGNLSEVQYCEGDAESVQYVRCECGEVYIITKPFTASVRGMNEYATNLEENQEAEREYPEG